MFTVFQCRADFLFNGQFLFKYFWNILDASNGAFGQPAPLVRPLPWLLFLPLLFFLRITRFSLNIASMLMGMESVKASTMVRFIQVRRRRIRALKFLGSRRIRQRRLEQAEKVSWKGTFYSIMSRAMCFQVTNSDMYEEITVGKTNEAQAVGTDKTAHNLYIYVYWAFLADV